MQCQCALAAPAEIYYTKGLKGMLILYGIRQAYSILF